MPNRDLTTGEIARLLRVSVGTVIDWINTGLLAAYCVPGSDHRRIRRSSFFAFLERHAIPLELACPRRLPFAVFDPNERNYAHHLRQELILSTTDVRSYCNLFAMGLELGEFAPGLLLLDLRKGIEDSPSELLEHVTKLRSALTQAYRMEVVDIVSTEAQKKALLALPLWRRPSAVLVGKVEVTAVIKTALTVYLKTHANHINASSS